MAVIPLQGQGQASGGARSVSRALGRIPWQAIILYAPQLMLAVPAAYASAQFATHFGIFPYPTNWLVGISFEWIYAGTLVIAGSRKRDTWYTVVNLFAVCASVLYVTLHAADKYGLFPDPPTWMLWLFAVLHGAPLAILNFSYGQLVHGHLNAQAEVRRQSEHKCPHCGEGYASPEARNGHMGRCRLNPRNAPATDETTRFA